MCDTLCYRQFKIISDNRLLPDTLCQHLVNPAISYSKYFLEGWKHFCPGKNCSSVNFTWISIVNMSFDVLQNVTDKGCVFKRKIKLYKLKKCELALLDNELTRWAKRFESIWQQCDTTLLADQSCNFSRLTNLHIIIHAA